MRYHNIEGGGDDDDDNSDAGSGSLHSSMGSPAISRAQLPSAQSLNSDLPPIGEGQLLAPTPESRKGSRLALSESPQAWPAGSPGDTESAVGLDSGSGSGSEEGDRVGGFFVGGETDA